MSNFSCSLKSIMISETDSSLLDAA